MEALVGGVVGEWSYSIAKSEVVELGPVEYIHPVLGFSGIAIVPLISAGQVISINVVDYLTTLRSYRVVHYLDVVIHLLYFRIDFCDHSA